MQKIDLKKATIRDLNSRLHGLSDDTVAKIRVSNPGGKHSVAVGMMVAAEIEILGHVGYYCAGMNQHAKITVNGNAGSGLAENMMSGEVRVKGNASQYCGATSHGGLIIIEGDAAARCGISMKGSDIVVGGSIGHMSAFMAQTGRLVVCGDAGDALGDSLYEARLFVRGSVKSLGADCVEKKMKSKHRDELAELLAQAGFNHDVSEFRRYGSARKLYNFNIDNASAY